MRPKSTEPNATSSASWAASALVAERSRFIAYVRRRVPAGVDADDVFQRALIRAVLNVDSLRDPALLTAWFYRILSHAASDASKRRQVDALGDVDAAQEVSDLPGGSALEISGAKCTCVDRLLETIRPDYAAILRRVVLDEETVQAVASELQITATNASVRLHRARKALVRELRAHCGVETFRQCMDCECEIRGRCGAVHRVDGA